MKEQPTETPPIPETPPPVPDTAAPSPHPADLDRLRSENDELRLRLRLNDARRELTETLRSAGARSPELLFEASKSALQFSEEGTLENGKTLVEDLKRNFPEQFGKQAEAASIDGGAGSRRPEGLLTKEALANMKPSEIARLDWADVRRVISN